MPEPIVCDTTVWLYLGSIDQIQLLSQLFSPVFTTESVCQELDIGRYNRFDIVNPRNLSWVTVVQPTNEEVSDLPANRLGPGEKSVLAHAHGHNILVVGLDDRQARNLAQQMGLRVIGTLGLIPSIKPFLEQLQREGFYISDLLLEYVLRRAAEL